MPRSLYPLWLYSMLDYGKRHAAGYLTEQLCKQQAASWWMRGQSCSQADIANDPLGEKQVRGGVGRPAGPPFLFAGVAATCLLLPKGQFRRQLPALNPHGDPQTPNPKPYPPQSPNPKP